MKMAYKGAMHHLGVADGEDPIDVLDEAPEAPALLDGYARNVGKVHGARDGRIRVRPIARRRAQRRDEARKVVMKRDELFCGLADCFRTVLARPAPELVVLCHNVLVDVGEVEQQDGHAELVSAPRPVRKLSISCASDLTAVANFFCSDLLSSLGEGKEALTILRAASNSSTSTTSYALLASMEWRIAWASLNCRKARSVSSAHPRMYRLRRMLSMGCLHKVRMGQTGSTVTLSHRSGRRWYRRRAALAASRGVHARGTALSTFSKPPAHPLRARHRDLGPVDRPFYTIKTASLSVWSPHH
jgi:hypothetical protein